MIVGLSGFSAPAGYPPAGTLISSGNVRDLYITITETGEVTGNGTETYNVYADGVGGSYESVQYTYYPAEWQRLGSSEWGNGYSVSSYEYDFNTWTFRNGKTYAYRAYANGSGGYYAEQVVFGNYKTGPVLNSVDPVDPTPPQWSVSDNTSYFPADTNSYANGTFTYEGLVWEVVEGEPTGNIIKQYPLQGGNYYADGTLFQDASDTYVEVPSGSGYSYFDGNDNRWEWDGSGNIVFRYSGLYSAGTYITNYADYNYYWDGSGGYYQGEYTGSGNQYAAAGTTTGNTSSGGNYASINGGSYYLGEYSSVEYNDGNGGTYWSTSYSGAPSYGTYLTSDSSYNYYSDGNGGYYTEAIVNNPSYGTFLYSDGSSSDLTWYAPDGTSGTWTYSNSGCSYYADGNGGSYSECGGWSASSGDTITSGSYYDSESNYYTYTLYYDGNGGYYSS